MNKSLLNYLLKTFIHTLLLVVVALLLTLLFPSNVTTLLLWYIALTFWLSRVFIYYIFLRISHLINENRHLISNELHGTISRIIDSPNLSIQDKYLAMVQNTLAYNARAKALHSDINRDKIHASAFGNINTVISSILEKSHSDIDDDTFYQLLLESISDLFDGNLRSSLLLYKPENESMDFKATVGYEDIDTRNIHFMKHESLIYDARSGFLKEPVIIRNYHQRIEKHLSHKTYQSVISSIPKAITGRLAMPLWSNGEFFAVLNIDQGKEVILHDDYITDYSQLSFLLSIICENRQLTRSSIKLSRYDHLTGLYNRSFFEQEFDKYLPKTLKTMMTFSIVLCDLNNLKYTNDNYGHNVGDQLLAYFAEHLKALTDDQDIVARLGGDEFIIVFHQKNTDLVKMKMKNFRTMLSEHPLRTNGDVIPISFAYGVSTSPHDSMIYDILFKIADENMYSDKATFKNNEKNRA